MCYSTFAEIAFLVIVGSKIFGNQVFSDAIVNVVGYYFILDLDNLVVGPSQMQEDFERTANQPCSCSLCELPPSSREFEEFLEDVCRLKNGSTATKHHSAGVTTPIAGFLVGLFCVGVVGVGIFVLLYMTVKFRF